MEGCWQHTDFKPSTCTQCGGTVFGFDGEDLCFTCVAKEAVIAVSPTLPAERGTGDGCTRDEPVFEKARPEIINCEPEDDTGSTSSSSRRKRLDRKVKKKRSPCSVHSAGDENGSCTCRRRRKRRPSPEGVDEYDKIIFGSDPIFSDYGPESEVETAKELATAERLRRIRARTTGTRVPEISIEALFAEALHRVSNSNTTLKFSIISVELKNIDTALRKVKELYTQLSRPPPLPDQWMDKFEEMSYDDVILHGLEVT